MKTERFDIHQHITNQIIAAIESGTGEFRLGDVAYAMEELIAELGAAFLCADLRITDAPRPDHAQYLDC